MTLSRNIDAFEFPQGFGVRQSSAAFFLLRSAPASAAENMAVDEVLLQSVAAWNKYVLRLYRWSEPAASFGYFQKYRDVERMTALRPLVRRPTGGGLVPHDADWTYSLVFPPTAPWYALKASESYQRVHAWIREAFSRTGLSTNLAVGRAPAAPKLSSEGRSPRASPGQCFVGAEQFDVLLSDQKIAGAAQRRTKQGLLIQGSIQPPPKIGRAAWEEAFLNVAGVTWEPLTLSDDFEQRVHALAAAKYSQASYNQRR
jgi:lipoate-protein ligase A